MNNDEKNNKKNEGSNKIATVVCLGIGILCLIVVILKILDYMK